MGHRQDQLVCSFNRFGRLDRNWIRDGELELNKTQQSRRIGATRMLLRL